MFIWAIIFVILAIIGFGVASFLKKASRSSEAYDGGAGLRLGSFITKISSAVVAIIAIFFLVFSTIFAAVNPL